MRILALAAAALMLLGSTCAMAQSTFPPSSTPAQGQTPGQTTGQPTAPGQYGATPGQYGSTPGQYNGNPQAGLSVGTGVGSGAAAAAANAARSPPIGVPVGSGVAGNPLTSATTGAALVSNPVPATQNPVSQGYLMTTDGLQIPVFGANTFTGSFAGTRPADRPDYLIQPGDSVLVNLYGAVNTGGVQNVDATGNIFVAGVGPVHVLGQRASDLQKVVSAAVGQIFTGAVGVYASVNQAGTLGVFVSGDVLRPGRYLGGAHDSVLFYLSQAGGVDASRGSMRNIVVRRNGQVVATYDLYDFLLNGALAPFTFADGDVIFVYPRGPMVGVSGAVKNPFAFEAPSGSKSMTGADLMAMSRPDPTVTGAGLHGYRDSEPRSAYFSLQDFQRVVLTDADHVEFRSDAYNNTLTVTIQGEVKGPSLYVLPRGSNISQLLAKIPLEGTDVAPEWVHVQRQEVAMEQKRAIQDSLYNLQKQVLTSAPATTSAASLATAQATLITQFVAAAQSVTPDGNIAIYHNGQFQDLRLEDGDTVILPTRTNVVIVTGEVLSPGGLTHAEGMTIEDCVNLAGGFAAHANRKRFVLRHRDGSAVVAFPKDKPLPGDELIVLPVVGDEKLQMFMDLSQLFFQLALSSATVISVSRNL